MKKIMSMLVVLAVISSCITTAFAAENVSSFDAPDLNYCVRREHVSALASAANAHAKGIHLMSGGSRTLSVPLVMQSTTYYCGPASVNMTLSYFGVSTTQSQLANEMGTTSGSGTLVYQVKNCLNSHLGSGTYEYVSTSELSFGNGLLSSIDAGKPIICSVKTGTLPIYSTYGHNTRHYIVATGYFWAQGGSGGATDVVYYNDPNYDQKYYGQHSCYITDMNTAISNNAGYYIMVADQKHAERTGCEYEENIRRTIAGRRPPTLFFLRGRFQRHPVRKAEY